MGSWQLDNLCHLAPIPLSTNTKIEDALAFWKTVWTAQRWKKHIRKLWPNMMIWLVCMNMLETVACFEMLFLHVRVRLFVGGTKPYTFSRYHLHVNKILVSIAYFSLIFLSTRQQSELFIKKPAKMYSLWKMEIFQPAMLVYRSVFSCFVEFSFFCWRHLPVDTLTIDTIWQYGIQLILSHVQHHDVPINFILIISFPYHSIRNLVGIPLEP